MKGWQTTLTWFLRILTGATFIFSGFVKGIDPWGTLYKLEDYMDAMHLPVIRNLLVAGVFLLCAYEFCIGVFLLLGCFRRSAPICAAVFMAVMLPLTLWIAVADPVADCGCFGDALLLSNWATFWKNVALSATVIWLWKYNPRLRCSIRPHLQWIGLLASAAFILLICFCGYIYQPLIDFRPYPIGSSLVSQDGTSDGDESFKLIYEKDGVEKSFDINESLPSEEDGWTFVRREIDSSDPESREDTGESTFRVWSDDGEDDVTEDVILSEGGEIIVLMPDLSGVSVATTWQLNSLYTWASKHDIEMIGIVSATPEEISEWRDISLAAYPIYTAEDTEIKMVARGNPAVVYLEDGRVVWKTTLRALGTQDFQSSEASGDAASYGRNDKAILYNISAVYVMFMALLICLSYLPELRRLFPSAVRSVSHDDKEDRSE